MASHATLSPQEAADRLAIRELFDAYAHCASIEGDRATGDSYTIAHHVYTEDGSRMMMVAWLRYLDTFTKVDQIWYIAERQIVLKGSETRPLGPQTAG
jgi:hypothetical protein